MNRKSMLIERVRESHNGKVRPVGVFVGINDHGCIRVGWSKCKLPPEHIPAHILNRFRPEEKQAHLHAMKDSDRFNLDRGVTEAIRNIHAPVLPPVHRGFARRFNAFKVRCERYFKDAAFIDDGNGNVNGMFRRLPPLQPLQPSKDEVGKALEGLLAMLGKVIEKDAPLSMMVPGRLFGPLPTKADLPAKMSPSDARLNARLNMTDKILGIKGTIAERKARGEGPHGVGCKCPW